MTRCRVSTDVGASRAPTPQRWSLAARTAGNGDRGESLPPGLKGVDNSPNARVAHTTATPPSSLNKPTAEAKPRGQLEGGVKMQSWSRYANRIELKPGM